jgi:hypothetical protein
MPSEIRATIAKDLSSKNRMYPGLAPLKVVSSGEMLKNYEVQTLLMMRKLRGKAMTSSIYGNVGSLILLNFMLWI